MSYLPLELNGKTAVVIGGTKGIGRAISHGLAEAGADVVATSHSMENVETVAAEIEERGKKTLRLQSDVRDRASLQKVFGSLTNINVRMVSYGGSDNNISLLVPASQKKQVLQQLNSGVFGLV